MIKKAVVVLTATIHPLKHGARRVVVSGTPQGEMPVVKVGTFPALHRLIDEVWLAIMQREPQVVTVSDQAGGDGGLEAQGGQEAQGDGDQGGESGQDDKGDSNDGEGGSE